MENETDSAESETEKEENKVGNSENNSEISVVREKISSGEYSEVSGDTVRLKSAAYKRYTLLYCTQNDAYTGYVKCTQCSKIMKHTVHSSGTTHLKRHAATHSADSRNQSVRSQTSLTSFLVPKKKLNDADRKELLSSLAYFCARDIRPFSAVEGPGFKKVMQNCIALGSKYGKISVDDFMPSRTTVAARCHDEVAESRHMLVDTINSFVAEHGMICVTTDMWTDGYSKKNFVAVTTHMLVNGEMKNRTLQAFEGFYHITINFFYFMY